MANEDILYIIKYQDVRYIDYLLHTGLYMQAAASYGLLSNLSSMQKDPYEAPASNTHLIFKNSDHPIWCCSYVTKDDICGNTIRVYKKTLLEDFKGSQPIIFNYKDFEKSLIDNIHDTAAVFGPVHYEIFGRNRGEESMRRFTSNCWYDALLTKNGIYAHQHECRLALAYRCEEICKRLVFKRIKRLEGYKPYELPMPNLIEIANIVNLDDIRYDSTYAYLPINNAYASGIF